MGRTRTPQAARTTVTLGVDIGGTFTDIVAVGGRPARLLTAKVLTDYEDLARGVMTGIERMLAEHAIPGSAVAKVVHGTTLVTNSLIERRGARTALVVTRGFADVLEMARESRYDIYDIDIELPRPLVPRNLVFEITERLGAGGEVIVPLADGEIPALADALRAARVESVAICLLHAFTRPEHERRLAQALGARLPGVAVCVSSEVIPDIREYERASTTVANAYVRPVIERYLRDLEARLRGLGMSAALMIMTSDGGLLDCASAARFPVRLTESGPAGGAKAAAYIGRICRSSDLLAYDMGGTTAKLCVIDDGKPLTASSFEFGRTARFARGSGLPLQIPVVEMIEIGAGGGSIAEVNSLGQLQVGPRSANALPGPACYGRGGEAATVTDADLVLGHLGSDSFLQGRMPLDVGSARRAIERNVAKPLRMSIEEAAHGIYRVVNANMARAAKVHCLEHGIDVRRLALFAYGGAGPIHAYGVARILGVTELVYPLRAGVLSAFGFLVADPGFEVVRGRIDRLAAASLPAIEAMLAEMEDEAKAIVRASVPDADRLAVDREVAVRFAGQSFELYVALPPTRIGTDTLRAIEGAFTRAYAARYHAHAEHDRIETVRWKVRVTASGRKPAASLRMPAAPARAEARRRRPVYLPERGGFVDCAVLDRHALAPGRSLRGPVIVEEPESTVLIGPDARGTVMATGDLHVVLAPAKPARRAS